MQTQRNYAPLSQLRAEDQALFEGSIVQVTLQLVPEIKQTREGDIIIRSFTTEDRAVELVFSGRRAQLALPLVSKLRARLARAHSASGEDITPQQRDSLRLTARAEGTWKRRFYRDAEGWQTHRHQFHVARWVVLDGTGKPVTSGEYSRAQASEK